MWLWLRPKAPALPDPPALVTQMREVARLETLDVTLYKKVSFAPDPAPKDSLWGEVANWARYALSPPKGKAIVFAVAHVGLDISKLQLSSVRAHGREIDVVLPPLSTQVELKPGDTEVIGSNLDSEQTAKLFDLAKSAFESEVDHDAALHQRATESAQRALRGLLVGAGFTDVRFVTALPTVEGS
jgi:hypothetical protein